MTAEGKRIAELLDRELETAIDLYSGKFGFQGGKFGCDTLKLTDKLIAAGVTLREPGAPCPECEGRGYVDRTANGTRYAEACPKGCKQPGARKSLVLENAENDPSYAPYCLGCRTMERMEQVERFYWKCRHCGVTHDERPGAPITTEGNPRTAQIRDAIHMAASLLRQHYYAQVPIPGSNEAHRMAVADLHDALTALATAPLPDTERDPHEANARTLRSLAAMLGWGNVPPQHVFEAEIRALKARATAPLGERNTEGFPHEAAAKLVAALDSYRVSSFRVPAQARVNEAHEALRAALGIRSLGEFDATYLPKLADSESLRSGTGPAPQHPKCRTCEDKGFWAGIRCGDCNPFPARPSPLEPVLELLAELRDKLPADMPNRAYYLGRMAAHVGGCVSAALAGSPLGPQAGVVEDATRRDADFPGPPSAVAPTP